MLEIDMAAAPGYFVDKKGADAVCLSIDGKDLTWGELDRVSNQVANYLIVNGVAHEEFVTIALPNTIYFFAAVFGVHKASAIPQIISPKLPKDEAQAMLELAKPKVVIGDIGLQFADYVTLPSDFDVSDQDDAMPAYKPASHWKAMSSGGSTGRPKIIVDHEASIARPDEARNGLAPGDTVMPCGPFYHNGPYSLAMGALTRGCKVVAQSKFDAEGVLRLFDREGVNFSIMVPTMMHRIWRLSEETKAQYDLSALRFIIHTAAPIAPWLKRAWIDWLGPDRIMEGYGGTEATGFTFISGREWLEKPGSVGRFLDGAQVRIVDDNGKDLPPGEIGEIFLKPFEDPNQKSFHYVGAQANEMDGGWSSLGDIGWLDEDGYLYLADRRTDLIITGGANIFPAEVEAALEEYPGIICGVAIGLPSDDLGETVHAIIQYGVGEAPPSEDALRDFMKEKLALYKNPRSYEFTTEPLRDEAGKVRRSRLKAERAGGAKNC